MKKYPTANVLMAASLLLATTGCSLFAPRSEDLLVDSEPQEAQVIVAGQRLTTPCTIRVPCDKDVTVVLKKEGYRTRVYNIKRTLGKCGTLDLVGGIIFLLPAVGLFSGGAYTLEQHTIFAPLIEVPSTEQVSAE